MVREKEKKPTAYAFIDSQNLYSGIKNAGWKLDYVKFRQYLRDKYGVRKAYIFIGFVDTNASLYETLQEAGYLLIFKPTLELPDGTVKGNVDAELVLHTMIHFRAYDKAIIVSNDGDFHCLVEYLEKQGKLLRLLAPNRHFSGLLRHFNKYIVRIDLLKNKLEIKKTKISGRSKP